MSSFESALKKTLRWEGGYVNDPEDRGGETYCGISRKSHPTWEGWDILDKAGSDPQAPIRMHRSVEDFYKDNYWDKICGSQIFSGQVASALFDFAVNSGVATASKIIQRIVGVEADGVIGKHTIGAINNSSVNLTNTLCEKRLEFLKSINPQYAKKYIKGWTNRVNSFKTL